MGEGNGVLSVGVGLSVVLWVKVMGYSWWGWVCQWVYG